MGILSPFNLRLDAVGGVTALMKMDESELQVSNALSPMFVRLSGRVIEESELQFAKAQFPILVTPSGIAMNERDEL